MMSIMIIIVIVHYAKTVVSVSVWSIEGFALSSTDQTDTHPTHKLSFSGKRNGT